MRTQSRTPCAYLLLAMGLIASAAYSSAQTENLCLIPAGCVWKYLDNGVDQGTAWRLPTFDDSAWSSGPAQLGYGDGDEATIINYGPNPNNRYITSYFRRSFVVDNPSSVSDLIVRLLRDDGAVMYLNGVEVFRSNMPGGDPIAFNTPAASMAGSIDESTFFTCSLSPSLLVNGANLVAVEVHQSSANSSDLSFDLELTVAQVAVLPPIITRQPEDITALARTLAYFSVETYGTLPWNYQWRKDTVNLSNQTNEFLTLRRVSETDAGSYDVLVSNAAGSVVSESATLTVLPAPTGPGAVDLNFDPTLGGELLGIAGGEACINAVLSLPNGKLVIGGSFSGVHGMPRNNIARLNPDQNLDASFGIGLGVDGEVYDLALQSDGKIVLVGTFNAVNGLPASSVARLHPNGQLDTSFISRPVGTQGHGPTICAIQSDGRILIGGPFSSVHGVAQRWLARLKAGGALDTNFNANASMAGDNTHISGILLQPDGRILVMGNFVVANQNLIRLNPDGSLDTSFNVWLGGPGRGYTVNSVAIQSDGKLLMSYGYWPAVAITRMNPDGSQDRTFQFEPGDVNERVWNLEPQADGKILIKGAFTRVRGVQCPGIARLNSDGSLDTSFVSTEPWQPLGEQLAPALTPAWPSIGAVLPLPDGRVLISGSFSSINGVLRQGIARLNHDGTLDTGYLAQLPTNGMFGCHAMQSDGKVLFSGWLKKSDEIYQGVLGRLNVDGSQDTSFGGGWVDVANVNAISVQPDGSILIGGYFSEVNGVTRPSLARLNADGVVDAGFNPDKLDLGDDHGIAAVGVQSDGKTVVGGQIFESGQAWNIFRGIARYNLDSSLDTAFNSRTLVDGTVFTIIVQPDGKLVIGGDFESVNGVARPNLARLNPDGGLDTSFNPPPGPVQAIARQSDGQLIVVRDFTIARLDANGNPDASFHSSLNASGAYPGIYSIAMQNGQVLIGGSFSGVNGIPRTGIARLNAESIVCRITAGGQTPAGHFKMRLVGIVGAKYQIEAATDLCAWMPLCLVTNTQGQVEFADPAATTFPRRFYRAKLLTNGASP